jgi:heavy metal sensor kinase
MIKSKVVKRWATNLSTLRFRLIGWYVVMLVLTLAIFSVYFFFQFRYLQQVQQDTSLQASVDRLRGLIEPGRPENNNTPSFRTGFQPDPTKQDLIRKNIQVRILNTEGKVLDSLGSSVSEMPTYTPTSGSPTFVTLSASGNIQWRIYTQSLPGPPSVQTTWIQVGQPVLLLDAEINSMFAPILLGTVIALVSAVLGGLFLANRALSPIDKVTRTAQAISTRELSKRIDYHGPPDEIGRLAKTLDLMFDRLESGFEQERRFTSDASHELRTPLTALKGRLEVTLSRPRTEENYRQTLAELHEEVDRLIRLSSSLLYLTRLDQSKQTLETETLSLSDLLESIVDSMQPMAELKQIELEGKIPTDLEIAGNLDQLTRLFLNLLDNALKYTPEGGKVTVQATTEGPADAKKARVSIIDTGPGIAAEHLPKLFNRFYRVEADRASTSGGAGLGLAIAQEIAIQHSGSMEVESQLGQGTTMLVKLPLLKSKK